MLVRAPAKINLFLRVLAREDSGYHQIETLFTAVNFYDEIQFQLTTGEISLRVVGSDLGPIRENLVYRAATLFFSRMGASKGVDIILQKKIPTESGLGGGSSDAGATLRTLNFMLGKPFSSSVLMNMAIQLGADVPFFSSGLGAALAWGRGERLMPIGFHSHVVLALTSIPVGTAGAYDGLVLSRRTTESGVVPREITSLEQLATFSSNHFEENVFERYPELEDLRQSIERVGSPVARLSGSGGTVFGLFRTADEAHAATNELSRYWPDIQFVVAETLDSQPEPNVLT
ncbi:MAG: 4-(cytidine 5'-diphospho)-2-C-methyl-D-erythritol kinase [Gemmatimonadetes bacterium]|nr:4-(cytidine 5'-diphospho)-2-C-methyl-D-erythritol kinase [Gemmatimonadota bacterium]